MRSVIDASNQSVAASYAYDAFGRLASKTGTLDQPYQFSTKPYYADLGLSYYGYRFYSPTLGRWLTRDPIGEAGGVNLYEAMGNDAVNEVDPHGLFYDWIPDAAVIGYDIYNLTDEPSWGNAGWLGADIVTGAIPFVPAVGYIRIIGRGAGALEKSETCVKAWKVGEEVDKATRGGRYPVWDTVKRRVWKNEAHNKIEKYAPEQIERMKKGLAVQTVDPKTGKLLSRHVHHINGRDIPNPHNPNNLEIMDAWDHYAEHANRNRCEKICK